MKLLVLGGTVFLGRHLVEAALARGDEVTLFHRGKHGKGLFPAAEEILGDRDGGLDLLKGRRWDAVVDTSGYVPRVVQASAALLADATGHYTFISSVSVYANLADDRIDEEVPVGTLDDPTVEEITGETYGPLKALCEEEVRRIFSERALILRPGLIVGPHDPSDRFTYWVERGAASGRILAPGSPQRPIQIIDARDLAAWNLRLIDAQVSGTFNAVGPKEALPFGAVLDVCRAEGGHAGEVEWVDEAFLGEQEVQPWSEVPVWVPESDASMRGLFRVDATRAFASGLRCRPIEGIVRDTLAWVRSLPEDRDRRAGLPRERETRLLEAWNRRKENET
ncbi:MAG: epimerase [Candidatus Eisenbacteria bacterium]|nr:epimerase [Candidatus Latescibacterota bacterium]MBD3301746.1 epimerase [Candidatus Eisenbacteria bacterium]